MDEFDFWCLFSIILLGLQIYSSYKFIQYCERKLNISIRGNQQTESTRKLYMEPLPSTSSGKFFWFFFLVFFLVFYGFFF